MALVARASKTVRNKNIIIFFMCALFLCWFAYDGFHTYPASNDRIVNALQGKGASPEIERFLEHWQGWSQESPENRERMDQIIKEDKTVQHVEGWKTVTDIAIQRGIVTVLGLAVIGAAAWFVMCQRRRAIAEDATVSPAPGVVIPWENITVVDNARWKKMGIVDITYKDKDGDLHKANFDDYKLEREPLLAILDQLAEKAVNAEFLPKEPVPPGAPAGSAENTSQPV